VFRDEIRFDERISASPLHQQRGQRRCVARFVEMDATNVADFYRQVGRGGQDRTVDNELPISRDDIVIGRGCRLDAKRVTRL